MNASKTLSLLLVTVVLCVQSVTATTITVDTANDAGSADGFCSLREAILAANNDVAENDCPAGSGADLIVFDLPSPTTILTLADLPTIKETVLIRGPGAMELTIDGGYAHRLLAFDTNVGGQWFGVEGLTLTNGLAVGFGYGGGVYVGPGETSYFRRVHFSNNVATIGGGGLGVSGSSSKPTSATVVDCYFWGNSSTGVLGGGGLLASGTNAVVRVIRSTFYDNESTSENTGGGAISVRNTNLVVEASTLSGNGAYGRGGGINVTTDQSLSETLEVSISNSTISENSSDANSDQTGNGGGAYIQASVGKTIEVELRNTVIAGNFDSALGIGNPDLYLGSGTVLVASGSTFIGKNEGCEIDFPAGSPNGAGDFVGTTAVPLNPALQPLSYHGGGTPVYHPETAPMSPLVDMGVCPQAATDQRPYGNPVTNLRPVDAPGAANPAGGDLCDIGAVEVWAEPNTDPLILADGFESGAMYFWAQ